MAETRSRKKGCPFCGHLHIFEVICTECGVNNDVQIPDEITLGRTPSLTLIIDSDGMISDEEMVEYCAEKDIKRSFEKRYFFDTPMFMARSKGFNSDYPGVIDIFWKCKQCLRTWSPNSCKDFSKCPNCGMNSGVKIIYGYPGYILFRSISRGEVDTGGCCIDFTNQTWVCKECGHTWGGFQEELDEEYQSDLIKDGKPL
jgi:hypothetical protein